jgi:ferric-dicitrate binding protein FerR (iron transport regulator)
MNNNYNHPEDYINDESFVLLVFKTDTKNSAAWDAWLSDNPAKIKAANEARDILKSIQIKDTPVSEQQLADAEERLRVSLQSDNAHAKVIKIRRRALWYAAAAVIIISLAFSLGIIFNAPEKAKLATNYGQVQKNKLPDGTEVILNAHSTITYGKKWKEGTDREVWIKGEAFFHVKKTPTHDKFIVHTDAFDIEVTGTSFNVINNNGKSSVILKEGSVKIHRTGEAEIVMKPGDFVEFSNDQIQKKTVTKQDYIAWTDNKLVFDNTPLTDVAKTIKEHYGVEVNLEGDNIAAERITGIMPNDNLDVLLEALNATQEIKVIHTKDSITFITEVQ